MRQALALISSLLIFLSSVAQQAIPEDYHIAAFNNDARKYIHYEFGMSEIYSVYIAEGDSLCDVFISGGYDKKSFSTTCKKTPVLKWAFDEVKNDLDSARFVTEEEYRPYYFKLSLLEDGKQIIIDSSSMRVENNDSLSARIDGLKKFIVNLWNIHVLDTPED